MADDTFRLGMLSYRATIKDVNGKPTGVLFECDCGRYQIVTREIVKKHGYKHNLQGGKVDDLPWCCGHCELNNVPMKGYRPWFTHCEKGQNSREERMLPVYKPRTPIHHRHTPNKSTCPREWFAWQQAKRISKGVMLRWEVFEKFYNDLGDAPLGAKLAKRDTSKKHGPTNSYWQIVDYFCWHDTRVTAKWVMQNWGVPRDYLFACRKARWLDVSGGKMAIRTTTTKER